MRKLGVLFCAIIAITVVPCIASGQVASLFGGSDGITAGIRLYTGYASDAGNTHWVGYANNTGIFGTQTWAFDYDPYHTAVIGLSMPIELPFGAMVVDGSLTFPTTWRVVETLGPTSTPDGYSRDWSFTDTMWTTLQGAYVSQKYGGVSALVGFRWDRWETTLREPDYPATYVGATSSPLDEGSLMVDLYLPIFGVKSQMNGFTFGVIGAPVCSGDTSQTSLVNTAQLYRGNGGLGSGYFFEFFGDYTVPIVSPMANGTEANLSLFWKINKLCAKGSMDAVGIDNNTGTVQFNDSFTTVFRRWMFVVGGTIDYSLPLAGLTDYVRWFW